MIRRDLQEAYPQIRSRIDVIYNGYDPSRFSLAGRENNRQSIRCELGVTQEDKILLFVASGWRRKGLLELLKALPGLPGVKLWVLGRDKPAAWRKSAKKLGLASQVCFLDPRKDIHRLYHAVDVTVLPSWYDSFGFVTLESLACGTPAVASRFAGSHELIIPGVNGMTVSRPDEIQELQSAITEALKIRFPGPVAASVSAYTLENNVKKTLALIERAAASHA
jgi:UDP-glucose:(heptosyl)LPS alpha-1,3-glucosyltransferase